MIILSWLCTFLVLVGFAFNSRKQLLPALIIWIIGDVGWIVYDFHIDNYSHATLSTIIILINIYGIYNINIHKEDKENENENVAK